MVGDVNPNDYVYAYIYASSCAYLLIRTRYTRHFQNACTHVCRLVSATRAWASIAMHTFVHIRRTCMLHRLRCIRLCASVCSQPVTSTLMPLRVSLCPCCLSFCYFGGMKLAVSQSTGYQPAYPSEGRPQDSSPHHRTVMPAPEADSETRTRQEWTEREGNIKAAFQRE